MIVVVIEPGDVEDVHEAIIVHCGKKQEDQFRARWGVGCKAEGGVGVTGDAAFTSTTIQCRNP